MPIPAHDPQQNHLLAALSADVYQRLVVREALVPFVDPQSFAMKETTKRRYFELCTNKGVYDYTDKMISGGG